MKKVTRKQAREIVCERVLKGYKDKNPNEWSHLCSWYADGSGWLGLVEDGPTFTNGREMLMLLEALRKQGKKITIEVLPGSQTSVWVSIRGKQPDIGGCGEGWSQGLNFTDTVFLAVCDMLDLEVIDEGA